MAYGIRILNAAGTVQIDDTYRNLALSSISTVNVPRAYVGAPYCAATFTITATSPVVAVRCSVACGIMYVERSGNSWTYYVRAASTATVTVTYYVFDVITTMPGGVGLKVINPATGPVFHSGLKYMRVVEAIRGKSTTAYGNRVYNASKVYAWVTSGEASYSKVNGSQLEFCQTGAAVIAGGLNIGKIVLSSFAGGGGSEPYNFSGIVIDVTNF